MTRVYIVYIVIDQSDKEYSIQADNASITALGVELFVDCDLVAFIAHPKSVELEKEES
jgi:hypothetical protein